MAQQQSYVMLPVQDGSQMQAYTALPSKGDGPFPGLILFQEAFGVNSHIRSLCDRFADQGYVVIAPELFHRTGEPGIAIDYKDFAAAMPHMQALSTDGLKADIQAAWDWLQQHRQVKHDAVVCSGYCMGGRTAFLANSFFPFKAAASYYGGRIVPDLLDRAAALQAPMLFFWGGQDKHIPQEHVRQLTSALDQAGKDYINVVISFADHGFFCEERGSYNPKAAQEAWALTTSFFKTQLS